MRIAVLAPRYHPSIVGGADEYLRKLLGGLQRQGFAIEVLTSRDTHIRHEGPHALVWDNALAATSEPDDDALPVRRFETLNLSAPIRARWSRQTDDARAAARRLTRLESRRSHLADGFHEVERWADEFTFRWSGAVARLQLHGERIEGLRLRAHSVVDTRVSIDVDGVVEADAAVPGGPWTDVEVAFAPRDAATITLGVRPTFRPDGDQRTLGIAVRAIEVVTRAGVTPLDLGDDRQRLLDELPTDALAAHLDREAGAWPLVPSLKNSLLKGPLSPGLLRAAVQSARRSDVVLATNAPFTVMATGLIAARLARRPLVLLPFLHLRDPYHHGRVLRHLLSRADRVMCLSRASTTLLADTWGATTRFVGGGIEPAEFEVAQIDGHAFRQRVGVGSAPLVVTVARKTPSKGYGVTCEAVRTLRQRGLACEHVLVGPDEDGHPVDPAGGRYVGPLPRGDVLSALAACDVFALPSVFESFGLAYLEAWMFEKPVVGHRLCDPVRELIEPGRDGLLVGDVREMASALEALITDPARRAAFGLHGRRKTLEHHTWSHVVDRASRVFAELGSGEASVA